MKSSGQRNEKNINIETAASVIGTNATTYSVAGTADFDCDDEDVLFRNPARSNVVWSIQNCLKAGATTLTTNAKTISVYFEK